MRQYTEDCEDNVEEELIARPASFSDVRINSVNSGGSRYHSDIRLVTAKKESEFKYSQAKCFTILTTFSSTIAFGILVAAIVLKNSGNSLNQYCENETNAAGNNSKLNLDYSNKLEKFFWNFHVMIVMQQITVVLYVFVKSHVKHMNNEQKIERRETEKFFKDIEMTESSGSYKAPSLDKKEKAAVTLEAAGPALGAIGDLL